MSYNDEDEVENLRTELAARDIAVDAYKARVLAILRELLIMGDPGQVGGMGCVCGANWGVAWSHTNEWHMDHCAIRAVEGLT